MGWVVHLNPSNVEEWWLKATFLKTTPTPTSNKVCQTLPHTHFFLFGIQSLCKRPRLLSSESSSSLSSLYLSTFKFYTAVYGPHNPPTSSFFCWAASQDTSFPPKPAGSVRGDEAEQNPTVYMSQLLKHHHTPMHGVPLPCSHSHGHLQRPSIKAHTHPSPGKRCSSGHKMDRCSFLLRFAVYFINLSLSPPLPLL